MNNILLNNATLTSLRDFLNKNYAKKSKRSFTVGDVQGYIRRGRMPKYMGSNLIELNTEIESVKLYNVKN